jgi:signal transduction histidine kinase
LDKAIATAQAQVRSLSKGLLPVEVDPAGLKQALGELVESVGGMNEFVTRFECDEGVVVADNAIATHLYRIAQEAVRNALEHGAINTVTVRLHQTPGILSLSIIDDGAGLNAGDATSFGSGLAIMKHRAEMIGAELTFDSSPGRGFSVICRLTSDPSNTVEV